MDYLRDYVTANSGGSWNLTTNGGMEEGDKAVAIGKDATVDFSGVTKTIGEGEDATTQSNIVVNKTTENGTTKVTFDLSDDVQMKKLTVENQYVTNVDETNDNSVTNISYVKSHDYYLRNGNVALGQDSTGADISYGEGANAVTQGYKADEYGNIDMTVQNDNGETKHVVLTDIASKKTQDEMQEQLGGAVMYDELPTGGYNTGSVTLGGGDHPYSYDSETKTATGGVTLTNVAYAVTDKTDIDNYIGSAAVNVDLLKDYVSANSTAYGESLWKLSTNGGTEEGDNAVAIGKDATVDFSSADNNLVVSKAQNDESSTTTNVQFKLADDLTLGSRDGNGNSISISGTDGMLSLTSVSGSDSNTIFIGQGQITGLTNDITSDWKTFMQGPQEGKTSYSAATEYELWQLAQHSVQYALDEQGGIDKSLIELGGIAYGTNGTHKDGTLITNVAYADINSASSGSHAVNVDLLKDYVGSVKTELQGSDQHLLQNSASEDGSYSVSENHDVTLNVGTGKEGETTTNVVIKDVASHTEVGNINDINKDLWNKDEITGEVSENPPTVVDAINNVNTKVDAVDEKVGDTQYKHTDGSATTIVTAGDDVTTSIGKLDGAIGDLQGKVEEAGKHSTVSVGNGLELVTNPATDAAGTDYNVSLKDNFTLGGKDNQTGKIDFKGSEGTLSASGNINAGSFSTTGGITIGKNTEEKNVIGGLQNITWNPDSIVSGQAATEDQLKEAMSGAVQYDRNEDGSIDKTHVTFNKGGDSVTLQNVAAGKVSSTSTQAVNGSQLYQRDLAIYNNSQNIQMLSNSVNKLDNRIDRVGAGAAALAALHPLDFDPDAKWDFAAGYGNYRGASAVAMGAYYRPNEDVMLSVGGSMGGGENMVNAGVSIKLGAGSSHVSTSRVAMAKEIESLRGTVAQLTALVNTMVGS